jgi:N-carbamoylputrescine amidase
MLRFCVVLSMKITVCQLHNGRDALAADWDRLVAHVREQRSDFVLLPEMPFFPWFSTPRQFDAGVWRAAVAAHDTWEKRLSELAPAKVVGTRPMDFGARRYSVGFFWNEDEGISETFHVKSCLSNEEGSWETTWYEKGTAEFKTMALGVARVGMLIGLELWVPEAALTYAADGAQIVAIPRVDRSAETEVGAANEEWLAGGRAAAIASGAFCISSSRGGNGDRVGGAGWILAPDGQMLATTSSDAPFMSAEVDLEALRPTRFI